MDKMKKTKFTTPESSFVKRMKGRKIRPVVTGKRKTVYSRSRKGTKIVPVTYRSAYGSDKSVRRSDEADRDRNEERKGIAYEGNSVAGSVSAESDYPAAPRFSGTVKKKFRYRNHVLSGSMKRDREERENDKEPVRKRSGRNGISADRLMDAVHISKDVLDTFGDMAGDDDKKAMEAGVTSVSDMAEGFSALGGKVVHGNRTIFGEKTVRGKSEREPAEDRTKQSKRRLNQGLAEQPAGKSIQNSQKKSVKKSGKQAARDLTEKSSALPTEKSITEPVRKTDNGRKEKLSHKTSASIFDSKGDYHGFYGSSLSGDDVERLETMLGIRKDKRNATLTGHSSLISSMDHTDRAASEYQGILFGKTSLSSGNDSVDKTLPGKKSLKKQSDKEKMSDHEKRIRRKSRKDIRQSKKQARKKQMRGEAKRFVIKNMLAAEEEDGAGFDLLAVNLFKGYAMSGVRSFAGFAGNFMKRLLILAALALLLMTITVALFLLLVSCLGSKNAYDDYAAASTVSYASYTSVSEKVESYRAKVLREALKYGKGDYVDLFLAVMMQESGGMGNDVFQCLESLGLPPNTLSVEESIKQGVKYLSAMLDKAKVSDPKDMDHIKLALQGYNMGGGYIDYAVKEDGGWTQENVIAYAKMKSGGVKNSDARAELLGSWRYGDSYYTDHVLRYYPYASAYVGEGEEDAIDIPLNQRMSWLFPDGIPKSPKDMEKYLETIEVPITNEKGKETSMRITVHKKLSANIKGAFEDMKKARFKVIASATAGYTWRMMASNSGKVSYHSYGCVVDLNWTHNGATYTGWPYDPKKDEYAVNDKIVKIWAEHGFYWGGNWSKSYFDPMHFTYVNH